jgi:Carboxypeptidase regulatory-like domain/TonB-dependent Receptor Plug Domain
VISSIINNAFSKMGGLLVLMAFAFATCLTTHLTAQELSGTKGGLQGSVTDSSGAVVPDATVTVVGNSDTRKGTTNSAGHWEILDLTPGPYTISVEREGFSKTVAKGIDVEINRLDGVNLVLQTGAVAQTVQVDATATSIDTGSTALSSNLTSSFYSQVPVARDVGSLFYTAPGVTNSGGTGTANPSIGGATGLENQYIADGVNITDGGYGGIGVFSPIYGSLGTGINLTFIEEVQVKTGAFEPKYGNGDGGIIQIVTKSGGTAYHGALAAFFAPDAFTAGQRYADNYFDRVNVHGHISSEPQFDASAEFGGYVPGVHLKDKLFFFGAYNPALNKVLWQAPSTAALFAHGVYDNKTTVNSYAAKVTFKINDANTIDASVFSDPTKTNAGQGVANQDTFPFFPNLNLTNDTAFSRWNYGTRSETVHVSSSISPTWQLDVSGSAKRSHFTETPLQDAYNIFDYTGIAQASSFNAQGLGYTQNPITHDYGFGIDTEKTMNFHGQHTFSVGFGYTHSIYALTKGYTGGFFTFPTENNIGIATTDISSNPALSGSQADAGFNLLPAATNDAGVVDCSPKDCPYYNGTQVYLQQARGIFSSPTAETSSVNMAIYGNDNFQINRHVTINAGIRWDEEQINGVTQSYVFNDNWSPRLGINYDPFGDRKSKIFFNWGRYTQNFPQDGALRDLSNELDIYQANWTPEEDANNNVVIGPNGTVVPVLDAAHLMSGDPAAGQQSGNVSASGGASSIFIAPKTKLNYEEEYVLGVERQFAGFDISAKYLDRRLLRIVEDSSGASPEGALAGDVGQQFVIGNLSSHTDLFVNEVEQAYTAAAGPPANCAGSTDPNVADYGLQKDTLGNVVGGACGYNILTAADPTPDGKPDGFSDPRRHYQAFELEANKSFSKNFMLRANYRWAKLFGNYEGLYRNDNGQSDPSISSLFDFTNGVLGLLGEQFSRGYLNTDRRQVGNLYGSYVVPTSFLKGFTAGIGLRGSAGTPISELGAHPVYTDGGEVPIGGRGSVGKTASNYQLDLHADYPLKLGERYKVKFTFDTFNVSNSRSLTAVDQEVALSYGVNNDDYLKPLSFQRAFYGRGSIRFEF